MDIEQLFQKVLRCFNGYTDHTLNVGDAILPQNVAHQLDIIVPDAKELLDALCDKGYLEFRNATSNKLAGYYLTQKGFLFYRQL